MGHYGVDNQFILVRETTQQTLCMCTTIMQITVTSPVTWGNWPSNHNSRVCVKTTSHDSITQSRTMHGGTGLNRSRVLNLIQ